MMRFINALRRKLLETNKLQGYLNIAQKAGYVICGGETLENYNKKLYLVLFDSSAQKSTLKIISKLKEKQIKIIQVENLGNLVNKPNCKVIGLKNKSLSDQIEVLLN